MIFNWWWLLFFLFGNSCYGWLDERPILESINGHLYISNAKDKNITLKLLGNGNINVNDINLLHAVIAAQDASRLVERWKLGVLNDVESTLQRLTNIVEGPNGLLRRINLIESGGESSANTSSVIKPSSDSDANADTTAQMMALTARVRRLESRVLGIRARLRIDDCASDPCQNGGTCIDRYGGFQCHCPPQWEGTVCNVDVNECERYAGKPGSCQNGATCVNSPGTFSCICPSGWHGFHCATQKSACDHGTEAELCGNGYCLKTNSPLGYTCICKNGWNHMGESDPSCRKDVNECKGSRYPCSVNPLVTCHNVPGTFYCGVCPVGYTGNGFTCQDIDECLVNNGGCSTTPMVDCINTLGSRNCGVCPTGYQGDGVTCVFVGTCSVNNGGCHALAICSEGPNSVALCLCPSGYEGTGRGPQGCRVAENACKSNPCIHGTCIPSPANSAGFVCSCIIGFTGTICDIRVNPCKRNPCKNGGLCGATSLGNSVCICLPSFTGPTCETQKQTCGGVLRNPIGSVIFPPNNGTKYEAGLSCAWVLMTNFSMVLNVTFTRFALEESRIHDDCKNDYVQIHDGSSAGGYIIGRYCGNKLPNNGTIISTHNALYIWFKSDASISGEGFAFNWTSIPPKCGGTIREDFGSISSPGYPGKYPTKRDCFWNIIATPGKRIVIHFITVMLEEHPTCGNDYLEVNETHYMGDHRLGLYCNHTKPTPVTSSGNRVTVHFHSDSFGTDSGFHLSYVTIPGSPDCGGVYTSESGEITSPGYHSGSYRSDLECEWEIRLPEDTKIRLTWVNFKLEPGRNCMFDSVQIYQGPDTNSPLVGKFCGYNTPRSLTVDSNTVLIRFESDSNFEEGGFILKYEVECGGTFTEPSGIIKSPFYPNPYPASKDCVYLISQPPGKAISLQFEFMDIEEGIEIQDQILCYFDRLEIRDGDTKNSTLLKKLCGPEQSMPTRPIVSTHNYMLLEFFTDASIHNLGFKLNYTTIDLECGAIIKKGPGSLTMPGKTATWRHGINCYWKLRAPPNHVIQITWTAFPHRTISTIQSCSDYAYVELTEPGDGSEVLRIGRYCVMKPPPEVTTSQGNELTIHLKWGSEVRDNNFELDYVFINSTKHCGGHYHAERGFIRSPNYPKPYPRNIECVWIIEALNKYLVKLNFKNFQLEHSANCRSDYLEIRSGSQPNSPLLGKFCGNRIENELTSMTNQMYIKFKTDSNPGSSGFELQWDSTKEGCGGTLHGASGSIISPNYPQNYHYRMYCTWDIHVSAGSAIKISFLDLDINCAIDLFELYNVINGYPQHYAKVCGNNVFEPMVLKSNHVRLIFRSKSITSGRGFHLHYTAECNHKLTGFNGVIESPNFPQNYDIKNNCTWVITAPPGNRVNITFSNFNVYRVGTGRGDGCNVDYVKFQEGDDDKPVNELAKKCGDEDRVLPLKISSNLRQMFITFISISGFTGNFRLEWYIDGCSKILTKPQGTITSPRYPNGKEVPHSNIECRWLIRTKFDKSIEITFPVIETTKIHTCEDEIDGAMEIYNGHDETAHQLTHNICYSTTPVVVTSTGNEMFIKYRANIYYTSHGFTASYRSIPLKCGGKFFSQSGTIHSTNYPLNYPHNQYCKWLITVDSNHAINITFVELDIERSRNCTDDYVKIFDGDVEEAPVLATHCGSTGKPPYYVSSGNKMLVVMKTDTLVSAKGFKAFYNRTCGAHIKVDGQGVIRSSPTLHTLHQENCSWILEAKDPSDKISLIFNHIDLLYVDDCELNRIDIHEGANVTDPLLGQLCNNKLPAPFYSRGNMMTIHWVTDEGHGVGDNFDVTYSTFSNACGGKYTAEKGIIVSPNFPQSYPAKAECIWTIRNSPGNRISLSFEEFELQSSDNCHMDYVEVRDNDGIGKLHGVICGKNATTFTSSKNLWIKFKSAASGTGNPKGFRAEYSFLFGDELTGDSGEIASPLYPVAYRRFNTFSWRVTVEFNFVVKLEFTDFQFDSYGDYCFASLKIYDGYNNEAPLLQESCGITIPEPIISKSNVVFIEMINNYDRVGNLFHLKYFKVPRETASDLSGEDESSDNHETIILTDKNGTHYFTSPGFPNGYTDNLNYSWTFISPVGTHLVLRFIIMNLEETEECLADYVAVYNGQLPSPDSKTKPEKTVCLSNSTAETISGTNVMTVQFLSDSYVNKTGFSATVLMECGGIIEETNGVIKFDNSWRAISPRYIYSCEWVVKVRTGRRISVTVFANSIEDKGPKGDDNSCRSNYLMLKNGESSSSPLLGVGKYCSGVKPPVQNTSSNYLYVKLAISFATVEFYLKFRELGHDCGGRFQFSKKGIGEQEITSPNYPNIPTPHTECSWTFTSLDDHRIVLHFIDRFDLAFTNDCEREYVEVRDGGTDSSLLIGRYCKNTPPSTLTTTGNVMFVHYYTDMPDPRNGFKALITTSDVCGVILRDPEGGTITSPNYPEAYGDKDYHCSWWIISPSSHYSIKIQFEELTLPMRRNCSDTDHVTVYEKIVGEKNGPISDTEIGSYCGSRIPREPIYVLTSEAIITFDSRIANIKSPFVKGFRLNYTFTNNQCGGELNGMSGNLQTIGYPRPTTHRYCNWKITVPEGFQVVFQIEDLDLGEDKLQSRNHVTFHNDPNSVATIQVVKASTQSLVVKSSSNFMRLYFIALGSQRGMKARYFAQAPAPCGGIVNNWEGILMSPQAKPFNESAYYCKWIVRQPENVDLDEDKKVPLTVSFTVSGTIGRGSATTNCLSYLSNILIQGEESVAKICGNMTKKTVTAVSQFKTNIIEAVNATRTILANFKIAYKWHKCGGILTGPTNIIKTPSNVSYPVYCAWKVKYPDVDYTLSIKFETMHLNTCDKSYINIKGKTYRSPSLGKFCGNEKPQDIVSPTNEFLIEYYATDATTDFEIHIEPNEYACGGTVTGKSGEIKSPGFPRNYPNNTECNWEISGNNGYHVGLTFVERFNIESSDNCSNDYIEFFEWKQRVQNRTDHWSSLGKVCGREAPAHPFNSTTNKMKVKFVSNDKIEGDGFKAIWSSNCGGVYEVTDNENFIESPNYPYLYPSSSTCNYTLVAPEDRQIIVDFVTFSLEGNSVTCSFDNMTINVYSGGWVRSETTWCGVKRPTTKIGNGKVELIFKSDSSVNRYGFKFKYRLNDCGGNVIVPRVIEPVIDGDRYVASHTKCNWIIRAPAKKSVVLRFEALNVSDSIGSCFSNRVNIYEGNSTVEKNLTSTFCGDLSSHLPVIQSRSNIMTVELRFSSYWMEKRAFKAIVLFMNDPESGCGGNFNVTSNTQFKTQLSEFYEPFQDCHWLFFGPPGYAIEFTINQIDLRDTLFVSNETDSSTALPINNRTSCSSDYIEVRDGGSYGELIGHFCGNEIPPPITTTSRVMWIRFISDGVNEGRGVKGTLKSVTSPCGLSDLVVGNDSQFLTSPNFPESYPSEITCKWIIHSVQKFRSFKIEFENFNLEDSDHCQTEFLEIQDSSFAETYNHRFGIGNIVRGSKKSHTFVMGADSLTPIYRYCGSNKPGIYYSNFKDVQITYKTIGGQKKNKGFKIQYGNADCSRAYTSDHGRILHQEISECRFTIETDPNRTISAYFNSFFMPILEIRDGGLDGRIIQIASSYETPNPVFSTGNKLSFHVVNTVNSTTRQYSEFYDMIYMTSDRGRGCGGRIDSAEGTFTSPMYPNSFRNNSNCAWDISVPRGLKINLKFTTFDIGSKQLCETDYLSISEFRENGDEDPVITYCGEDTPAEYKSQGNRVLVTYATSINNGGSGWVASYTTLRS